LRSPVAIAADVALVLAADSSGSVSDQDIDLQFQGYAGRDGRKDEQSLLATDDAIRERGAAGVAIVLQGKLVIGDQIAEACSHGGNRCSTALIAFLRRTPARCRARRA
jgi:hypothetical protein